MDFSILLALADINKGLALMPSKASTALCQIDGLKTIYVYKNISLCLEFENEEQLNKTREKVSIAYKISSPVEWISSKKPIFAFTLKNPRGMSINQFILNITSTIIMETSIKNVPIVKIEAF